MDNHKGNGLIWIVVAIVVIVLAFVAYLYIGQKNAVPTTKIQESEENLEAEIDSVDINGIEAEFDALDKDLQNL